MSDKKLYLHKYCIIPISARLDSKVPNSAKIYLGDINVLSNKFGYLTYSDKLLAEMKDVSVRTIQNWHKILEERNHIKRVTIKKHVKTENGVEVRTERKLYVFNDLPKEEDSNNFTDTQKTACHSDTQKTACHSDTQKTARINNEYLNNESLKKDIVPRMPFSKEKKKNFRFHINSEQKKLHDHLIKYKPEWGKSLESDDICSWFLRKENQFSVEQVETAFRVYKQDAHKAHLKGSSIENMGGAMVAVMKSKRMPENQDLALNKEYAEILAKSHRFLNVTEKYVTVNSGNYKENIIFNLPNSEFRRQIDTYVNRVKTRSYE